MLATVRTGVVALTALLFASSPCPAQTEADAIRSCVKGGQKVSVTTDGGEVLEGRIDAITADGLSIRTAAASADVPFEQVVRIDRPHDGLGNGALIGLGTGAALGLIAAAADDDHGHCDNLYTCSDYGGGGYAAVTLLGAGLGTAVGVAVDALVHGKREIYRRTGGRHVTASPAFGRGVRGAVVSITW
jgi:hypothetical protein